MKTKYQRMSKEEKKQLVNDYKKTEKGKYMLEKLRNVLICGILLYVYSIYLIITAESKWNYIYAGGLLLFGSFFIFMSVNI